MATFRRIEVSIWDNDDFLRLPSSGAQDQFFYILTNSSRTESGLYRMSKQTMLWKTHSRQRTFDVLCASPLIEWDNRVGLVWITSALDPKYFRPNENIFISVVNDMKKYWPHRFVKSIGERYGPIYKEIRKGFQRLSGGSGT